MVVDSSYERRRMKGFDVSQVVSDDKHYNPFICTVCQNLVSLDAVVTNRCSHPFCRSCLEQWATECHAKEVPCTCPSCKTDVLRGDLYSTEDCINVGEIHIAAQDLMDAQPLAYRLLESVQVACIDHSTSEQCAWSGDYGKYRQHASSHYLSNDAASANSIASVSGHDEDSAIMMVSSVPTATKRTASSNNIRPTLGQKAYSSSQLSVDSQERLKISGSSQKRSGKKKPKNRGHADDKVGLVVDAEPEEPISLGGLRTPQIPRWDSNQATAMPTHSTNSEGAVASQPKAPLADKPPNRVTRNKSDLGAQAPALEDTTTIEGAKKNGSRDNQAHSPTAADELADIDPSAEDAENTEGKWNKSFSSLAFWDESFSRPNGMQTVDEASEHNDYSDAADELPSHVHGEEAPHKGSRRREEPTDDDDDDDDEESYTSPEEKIRQILDRAEKLKKYANAKFNKGEFEGARNLYTEGINVMSAISPDTAEERQLLSNMHSNRAVTYFREKEFETCIRDCDSAIACDPNYDKTWIRKWRALMALGNFDDALACLEEGLEHVPGAKRIEDELVRVRAEKEVLETAQQYLDSGHFERAKDFLAEFVLTSTNICILVLASKVNAQLGDPEESLELANKALRFNPRHSEALELRGYSQLLSGETERGTHMLYEAWQLDKDNTRLKEEWRRCQDTHKAFSQGRSSVKRGRYDDAVDHFTSAIKESGSIPSSAPLYLMLRTERAEAYLFSSKLLEALKDCQDVINACREYPPAWAVRSEVLISLGKAAEAKRELSKIRKSWGADNPTIEEGYRRVDFEMRVQKADDDLMSFVEDLQKGTSGRITPRKSDDAPHKPSHSRSASRGYDGELVTGEVAGRRQSDRRSSAGSREAEDDTRGSEPNKPRRRESNEERGERRPSEGGRPKVKRGVSSVGDRRRDGDFNGDAQNDRRLSGDTGKSRLRHSNGGGRGEDDENGAENGKGRGRRKSEAEDPERRQSGGGKGPRTKRSVSVTADRRQTSKPRAPTTPSVPDSMSAGGDRLSRPPSQKERGDDDSVGEKKVKRKDKPLDHSSGVGEERKSRQHRRDRSADPDDLNSVGRKLRQSNGDSKMMGDKQKRPALERGMSERIAGGNKQRRSQSAKRGSN